MTILCEDFKEPEGHIATKWLDGRESRQFGLCLKIRQPEPPSDPTSAEQSTKNWKKGKINWKQYKFKKRKHLIGWGSQRSMDAKMRIKLDINKRKGKPSKEPKPPLDSLTSLNFRKVRFLSGTLQTVHDPQHEYILDLFSARLPWSWFNRGEYSASGLELVYEVGVVKSNGFQWLKPTVPPALVLVTLSYQKGSSQLWVIL